MKMSRNPMRWIIILAAVTVGYFGWKLTARGAYESAAYTVLISEGAFEIREYPDLMMATTDMQFSTQGSDGSFMRLFRYISGANDKEQKVAMTTPVFMEPDSTQSNGQMGFVIPRKVQAEGIPEPTQAGVEVRERRGGRFAVVRFQGRFDSTLITDAESRLRSWMADRELVAVGEAEYAGYDPPWTPGPFRRNEILVRLASNVAE